MRYREAADSVLCCLLQHPAVAGADRHIHARARQFLGDRLADALAAACDDRHFPARPRTMCQPSRAITDTRIASQAAERLAHPLPELPLRPSSDFLSHRKNVRLCELTDQ